MRLVRHGEVVGVGECKYFCKVSKGAGEAKNDFNVPIPRGAITHMMKEAKFA